MKLIIKIALLCTITFLSINNSIAYAPVTENKYTEPITHIPKSEIGAKDFIYNSESGREIAIVNKSSGACGIGQALPCSKMASVCPEWKTDYECQDKWFTNYMLERYGSWENAQIFWLQHSWW